GLTQAPPHGDSTRVAEMDGEERRIPSESGWGGVSGERPPDEGVRMTVSHFVIRLQVSDDGHVLVDATASDDPLPLGDRAAVFLLNRREVRRRPLRGPWCSLISHVVVLLGPG